MAKIGHSHVRFGLDGEWRVFASIGPLERPLPVRRGPTWSDTVGYALTRLATIRGEETNVLTEQVRALSHERFDNYVATVTADELTKIDNALDLVLDLGPGHF